MISEDHVTLTTGVMMHSAASQKYISSLNTSRVDIHLRSHLSDMKHAQLLHRSQPVCASLRNSVH